MNPKEYSHANYRNLMKESEIYSGKNNCYFCPGCKRYVPKEDCSQPCPFCGSTEWNLDSPLVNEIINTGKLKEYMFETYKACIEPFTGFEMQCWKNGKFFHRISPEIIRIDKEHSPYHFKDMELWCVSHHGIGGCFLSFCLKWTEIYTYRGGEEIDYPPKVKFLTVKVSHEEKGGDFDDDFYFNLTWETLLKEGHHACQLWYNGVDYHTEKKKKICVWIHSCCEAMDKYDDKFSGCLYPEQLNKGDFTHLMIVLDDFTLIPRYWGYED